MASLGGGEKDKRQNIHSIALGRNYSRVEPGKKVSELRPRKI